MRCDAVRGVGAVATVRMKCSTTTRGEGRGGGGGRPTRDGLAVKLTQT